jgi:HK97 gp10 family phage protein
MAAGTKWLTMPKKSIDNVASSVIKYLDDVNRNLEICMNKSVNVFYEKARRKRPDFMYVQSKNIGRLRITGMTGKKAVKGAKHVKLVSDPEAIMGVPVRTGMLRNSIQKRVGFGSDGKLLGEVWTDSPYSKHIEFGTSKMKARPFMRPAFDYSKQEIEDIFNNLNA